MSGDRNAGCQLVFALMLVFWLIVAAIVRACWQV